MRENGSDFVFFFFDNKKNRKRIEKERMYIKRKETSITRDRCSNQAQKRVFSVSLAAVSLLTISLSVLSTMGNNILSSIKCRETISDIS